MDQGDIMNNVKPFANGSPARGGKPDSGLLKSEVAYRTKLQEITNAVYAAADIDAILIDAPNAIADLLGARRTTIYYLDGLRRELVSRFKSGDEISEIRVPVNSRSIAGYCAVSKSIVNIRDVYDPEEIAAIDPLLEFDRSWDRKTGFETRQVLAAPILFQSSVFGVVQIINRSSEGGFASHDEKKISELAGILGIAFYKQRQMTSRLKGRFDYLLQNYITTPEELNMAITAARERRKPVERFLVEDLDIPKHEVLEALSRYYNVPSTQYTEDIKIPVDLISGLKTEWMEAQRWAPAGFENGDMVVAMENPDDLNCLNLIRDLFAGQTIRVAVAMENDILNIIHQVIEAKPRNSTPADQGASLTDLPGEPLPENGPVTEKSTRVRQLLHNLLSEAREQGATAIHIEPQPGQMDTNIRLRINGVCRAYQAISGAWGRALTERIKIMSGLDITGRQVARQGKFRFQTDDNQEIILRVAIIPTMEDQEDVVMRFLPSAGPIALDSLGLSRQNLDLLTGFINQSRGLVLVSGPPGSGRTTVLHSMAAGINNAEKKIWTVESPVEIVQYGLRQVEAGQEAGHDYASAVEAFLQADPDVIMIGDMPDKKTLMEAIRACHAGCLVFSAIKSPGAPQALARLLGLNSDPFQIADVLTCILSRRLVRTLCPACKVARHPEKEEYDEIIGLYGPKAFKQQLNIPYSEDLTFFAPQGCSACNHTGYKGQTGIHELLVATEAIRDLIRSGISDRPLEVQIGNQAVKDGMLTLFQDGVSRIFDGVCDLRQVRNACL